MSSLLDSLILERYSLGVGLSQNLLLLSASVLLAVAIGIVPQQLGLPFLYLHVLKPLGLLPATAGCRRIGVPREKSNLLHDELDARHLAGDSAGHGRSWKVKSLWIYPFKSCAGVELDTSTVVKTGLQYDRWFALATLKTPSPARIAAETTDINGSDGSLKPRWDFLTMREAPRMANVKVEMWVPDPAAPGYSANLPAVVTRGVVRASFPCRRGGLQGLLDSITAWLHGDEAGTVSFTLPFEPTAAQIGTYYPLEHMRIWKDAPVSLNMGRGLPTAELAAYLGVRGGGGGHGKQSAPPQLSVFRTHAMREVFRDAPRKAELGWQPVAAFNDAFPINLLGLGSLADLSAKQTPGAPPLTARRFRANIILEGTPPYEEERWKYVRIGSNEYHVSARCVRCRLPNVDPDSGVKHRSEPDRTIRAERQVDAGAPNGYGCLAMQLVPRLELGEIKVGDMIEVKETGEHCYTQM